MAGVMCWKHLACLSFKRITFHHRSKGRGLAAVAYSSEYRYSYFFLIEVIFVFRIIAKQELSKRTIKQRFYSVNRKEETVDVSAKLLFTVFGCLGGLCCSFFCFCYFGCLCCNTETDAVSYIYNSLSGSGKMAKFNGRFIYLRIDGFKI